MAMTQAERSAKWRSAHPIKAREKARKASAVYRLGNKDKCKAYNDAHKEERNATSRRWNREHKPLRDAHKAARRALIIGVTIGNMAEIAEIYRQAREDEPIRCAICGELIPLGDRHVDHKYPLVKGGKHCVSNLQITHSTCNLSKGAKTP